MLMINDLEKRHEIKITTYLLSNFPIIKVVVLLICSSAVAISSRFKCLSDQFNPVFSEHILSLISIPRTLLY